MDRILEPELMDDAEQALAYAKADFDKENQGFVDVFRQYFPDLTEGHVLDLGCGPGDIPIRLARVLPRCHVTGIDGSDSMIRLAQEAVTAAGLGDRIVFQCVRMQNFTPVDLADAAISNSLVHHMPNPLQFWYGLKRLVKPGGVVLVMDLLRPETPEAAQAIVSQYAASESPILRRDFYNSLCAAFTEDEVAGQLAELNLTRLLIDVVDDRHWVVGGTI
jgi:ubiquinone/menaquinone biosynthesis C-methylase UbiE